VLSFYDLLGEGFSASLAEVQLHGLVFLFASATLDHFPTLAVWAVICRCVRCLVSVVPEKVEVAAGF
jgi:hypothetical protein